MMQIRGKFVACLLAMGTLCGFTVQAQDSDQQPGEISQWRASRMLSVAGKYATIDFKPIDIHSIQISSQKLRFNSVNPKNGKSLRFDIDLKKLTPFTYSCDNYYCYASPADRSSFLRDADKNHTYVVLFNDRSYSRPPCTAADEPEACSSANKLFATALNGLRAYALAHPNTAATDDFHQQASAWRALATKPSLAEAVRVYRLAAEDAIERKQLAEALNYYELGVQANPTWALGWYNAGLLAAEVSDFAAAAEHMQNYLELSPNADDAEAARDKMDLWKYKAGNSAIK